jgi:hypothetical protein
MLYSGLQTQVQKRFSRGMMFTSTWTWAKETSDADDTNDFELSNVMERGQDHGDAYFPAGGLGQDRAVGREVELLEPSNGVPVRVE